MSAMGSEFYPSQLKWVLNSLSGFSRMRNKLTLPFTQGKAGDIIYFKLPSNCMIDLSTLSFHFSLTTTVAASNFCVPPQYTGCLIDQLSVDINGINVQTISHYAQIYKLLAQYQSGDQRNRNAYLEWVGMTDVQPGNATLNNVSLAIKQWLGILGSNKIIDTNLLGEVTVSMRLIPNIAFVGSVSTGSYTMNNMSVQFDSINLDNPVYQQSIYRQLEQGDLKWGFQNIITNFGGSTQFPVAQTFSVSTQSLDYLIGTIVNSTYATVGNTYNQNSGSSFYFAHGASDITNASYQIGTVMIPNYRCDLAEQLSYTLDSLNLTTDVTGKSSETFKPFVGYAPPLAASALTNANTLATYGNGNYCFAARLCVGQGGKNDAPLLSGLSTQGTNTSITFRLEGTNQASVFYIPIVYAICTSTLTIGAGRQISLVV